MVKERLEAWSKKNRGDFPENIVFYRLASPSSAPARRRRLKRFEMPITSFAPELN
jgi:hypothetical protein